MPIVKERRNTLFVGGSRGRRFEVWFCPGHVLYPWGVRYRGGSHIFTTLREALCYAAGRGLLQTTEIDCYQKEIMLALDRKWDE